jgi:hypothetical protein
MPDQHSVEEQLKSAKEETLRLREENSRLRSMLGISDSEATGHSNQSVQGAPESFTPSLKASTPEQKIALFRNLFRGREDVYAVRWEGKKGKSGYTPAGVMDWRAIHSARPEERKTVARKTRTLKPLTEESIRNHLTGKQTIGVYPLLPDETCWFLAVDC